MIQRFGQKILALRKRQQVSLQQLADAFGYAGNAYLSRVETGQRQPSLELAMKVADFFGVTVDQLVRDDLELDLGINDAQGTTTPTRSQGQQEQLMQRFGEKLRALRRYHGMTVRSLAQALNYPGWSRISAIEQGKKKPTAEFVFKIAQVFNVTTDELLDDARNLDLPAAGDDQIPGDDEPSTT